MKLAATQALYAYWTSQCRGRTAPDRHDLDPAEMRGVLSHVFMLEVDGQGGAFPIRISGTRLDALFGRDLKGTSFADLWASDDHGALRTILNDVLDGTQPAVVGLQGAPDGHVPMGFELLILPLRHHGRTHARLLCGLFPSRTPSWIGLQFVDTVTLTSWRLVDRVGIVEHEGAAARGLRREHLVVYQGGRSAPAASVTSSQSRVKAAVPRSREMFLLTRGS